MLSQSATVDDVFGLILKEEMGLADYCLYIGNFSIFLVEYFLPMCKLIKVVILVFT